MENSEYLILIHKKLTGKISSKELLVLKQWLAESVDNQETEDRIAAIWKGSEDIAEHYQPDVAQAMKRFQNRISEERKEAIPNISTNNKVKTLAPRRRSLLQLAAAAAIFLAAGFFFWTNQQQDTADWIVISTDQDVNKHHQLPDGSTVWLNDHSRIKYPPDFAKNNRTLELEGEAFFKVIKAAGAKFTVETAETEVTVLGTAFGVRAKTDESFTEVDVVRGKVSVNAKALNQKVILTADKKLKFDHDKNLLTPVNEENHNRLSWHTGEIQFKQAKMGFVVDQLEQHFNVSIEIENPSIASCTYTSMFTEQNISSILQTMAMTFGAELIIENEKTFRLKEGKCIVNK